MVYLVILNWLHLLATVTWIGGTIFYVVVLMPSVGAIDPPQRGRLMGALIKRYAPFAWGAIIVLIISGILLTQAKTGGSDLFGSTYNIVLLIKHGVIAIMVLIGVIISFVIGPKLKPPAQKPDAAAAGPPPPPPAGAPAGPPPQILKLQKLAGTLGFINMLLGIAVLLLTSIMRVV